MRKESSDQDDGEIHRANSELLIQQPAAVSVYEKFFFDFNEVYNIGKPADIIRLVYSKYCSSEVTTVFRHWNRRNPLEPASINPMGCYNLIETAGFFDTVRYYSRAFSLIPDAVIDVQPAKISKSATCVRAVSNFTFRGTMLAQIPRQTKRKRRYASDTFIEEDESYLDTNELLRKRVLQADLYSCVSNFKHPKSKRTLTVEAEKDIILRNVQRYQVSAASSTIESNPLNDLLKRSQDVLIGRELPIPTHSHAGGDGTNPGDDDEEAEEDKEEKEKAIGGPGSTDYDGDASTIASSLTGHSSSSCSTDSSHPPNHLTTTTSISSTATPLEMISLEVYLKGMMVTYYNSSNQITKVEFHYFVPTTPTSTTDITTAAATAPSSTSISPSTTSHHTASRSKIA